MIIGNFIRMKLELHRNICIHFCLPQGAYADAITFPTVYHPDRRPRCGQLNAKYGDDRNITNSVRFCRGSLRQKYWYLPRYIGYLSVQGSVRSTEQIFIRTILRTPYKLKSTETFYWTIYSGVANIQTRNIYTKNYKTDIRHSMQVIPIFLSHISI